VGLDAGEAVPVADGFRGGALNLAARLCSLAEPGDVLATETVIQLARAVEGIKYGERRIQRVKGIAKPVTAVEVLSADRRVSRWDRRRLRRTAGRALGRRSTRLAGVAVGVAAVAGIVVLALPSSGSSARIKPQSIGVISTSGKVEGQMHVTGLGPLAVMGHTLWFANSDDKTLERFDLRTRKAIHPFVSVQHGMGGMAVGLGAVWVVDGTEPALLRIDPRYLTIQRIPLPAKKTDIDFTAPTDAAVGAGSVWVAEADTVFRVDPNTSRVVKTISVPEADLLKFGDGALWVGQSNASSVSKIDPKTNEVVQTVKLRDWIGGLAVGDGFVWVSVVPDDTLWKLDANGTVLRTIDVGHNQSGASFRDGAVWVGAEGKVQRIDSGTDAITSFSVVDHPADVFAGDGEIYVLTLDNPPPLKALPADRVATFSLAEDYLDDTDPAHAWPIPYRSQLEYATGAQLLNYPDAPAPRGSQLAPEVAAALPAVSADERTYTFHIRPGYRFSPPSNQEVTAQTFKYSIERALSPRLGPQAPGYDFVSDIAGAEAFHSGKAGAISGITALGDTLRIRLVAPAGDFLTRLSMPFFAAVPIGTPIVNGGVQDPIPSAGPYYTKVKWRSELTVLERNPNYRGPRPQTLERIVYDKNSSTHRTVELIASGKEDYTLNLLDEPAYARGGSIDARFGQARSGAAQLVQTPQSAVRLIQFNTNRGPFMDGRLRRAVSYALDRRALAAVQGETPTDSYLPRGFASAPRAHVYRDSPDLRRARALANGFHGPVVLYSCPRAECRGVARIVKANLAPIGIDVRVRELDDQFAGAAQPGAAYDLVVYTWYFDYPDPSNLLNVVLGASSKKPSYPFPSASVPDKFRRELENAALLRGSARATAYRRLTLKLEREVAPFAAYATPVLPELFSARLGCRVEQPMVGAVSIGALCVRAAH